MVERLFLTVPRGCLQFVIVVFPDHTHLLFLHDSSFLDTAMSAITKKKCAGSFDLFFAGQVQRIERMYFISMIIFQFGMLKS